MPWRCDPDSKRLHFPVRHSFEAEGSPVLVHIPDPTPPHPTPPVLSQQLSCVPVRNVYKPQELPGVVVYSCSSSAWKVKAGGSGVQGQPQLCNEFEANLSYTKKKKNTSRFQKPPCDSLFPGMDKGELGGEDTQSRVGGPGVAQSVSSGWVCLTTTRYGHIKGQRRSSVDSERQPPAKPTFCLVQAC